MGTLTVRENLNFSAALRLPRHYSSHDRSSRINMIIEDLGLTGCAETRVRLFSFICNGDLEIDLR